MLQNSYELLYALKKSGYLKSDRDPLWWPNSGTPEVIFGAILTQQSRWENVETSLEQLKKTGIGSIEALAEATLPQIIEAIKPSGFYNTKAERLRKLCRNILEDFGDFGIFRAEVDRSWLLKQKGIGMESADSILCYACSREAFVVDSYTARLLDAFGFHFDHYEAIQEWMVDGLEAHYDKVVELYGEEIPPGRLYARLHGKIVEFAKDAIRGKQVDLSSLLPYIV